MTLAQALLAAASSLLLLLFASWFRMHRSPFGAAIAAVASGTGAGIFVALLRFEFPLALAAAAGFGACAWAHEQLRDRPPDGALVGVAAACCALTSVLFESGSSIAQMPSMWIVAGGLGGLCWSSFREPLRRTIAIVLIAAAAIIFDRTGAPAVDEIPYAAWTLIGIAGLAPIIAEILQLRRIRTTLSEEAAWSILDPEIVARLVSPMSRFSPAPGFHRDLWVEMVRTSRRLGDRRVAQRRMNEAQARIQQIEVIRLRTRLLELRSIQLESTNPPIDPDLQ